MDRRKDEWTDGRTDGRGETDRKRRGPECADQQMAISSADCTQSPNGAAVPAAGHPLIVVQSNAVCAADCRSGDDVRVAVLRFESELAASPPRVGLEGRSGLGSAGSRELVDTDCSTNAPVSLFRHYFFVRRRFFGSIHLVCLVSL
uniref:Uncharacterized protein n=1 Tax=Plectus sambesii TaxID=2011161 RepID=A0A914VUX8_9BILA